MTMPSRSFNLLRSPWAETFHRLVSEVEENLMLISPFIKRSTTDKMLSQLQKRGVHNRIQVVVLTDLRPESTLSGSTDLEALVQLGSSLPKFDLTHLPSLHAKVYLADRIMAIITSGNLTDSGISGNLEYGVVSSDENVVGEIRQDFESYARLGAKVSSEEVSTLVDEMRELKALFRRAEQTIRAKARRAFKEKLEATHAQLLHYRARGKTTHSIFAEAILFLLARGPLRTVELHPLIQRLHPDICDDSVDRVIGDVHFGKKWKHYVRNAQQHLKRQGRIQYDGGRWNLIS